MDADISPEDREALLANGRLRNYLAKYRRSTRANRPIDTFIARPRTDLNAADIETVLAALERHMIAPADKENPE